MSRLRQWLLSFWSILISPTPKTFSSITQEVEDSFGEGIAWIVFIIVIFLVPIIVLDDDPEIFNLLVVSIILIPIWFLLFVFIIHKMNGTLFKKSNNYYDQLFYSNVGIYVVTSLLLVIAFFLNVLLFSLLNSLILLFTPLIYWLVVTIISVKAILNLSYFQSLGIVLISLISSSLGFAFIGPFLLVFVQAIPRFF